MRLMSHNYELKPAWPGFRRKRRSAARKLALIAIAVGVVGLATIVVRWMLGTAEEMPTTSPTATPEPLVTAEEEPPHSRTHTNAEPSISDAPNGLHAPAQ